MRMTAEGITGYQDVDNFEEALEVARGWDYDNFIFDGIKYTLVDGEYVDLLKKEKNQNVV